MQQAGKLVLWVGVASLVIGIYSRWTRLPIRDIEAQAFLQFTQACFLFSIAAFMVSCKSK